MPFRSSNVLIGFGNIRNHIKSEQVWGGCQTYPRMHTLARRLRRDVVVSTLDAELNDFGAQLAMLGGHAADRDG